MKLTGYIRKAVWGVTASLIAMTASPLLAETDYPTRPVTILVGAGPGGGNDLAARLIADDLTKTLGQAFVVENRPGASGARAAEYMMTQPADGYTLLLGNTATQIYNAMLLADTTFDPDRDSALAGMFGKSSNVLVVNKDLPVNSVAELVALAKEKPGELNYGSAGVGGSIHLAGAYFTQLAEIDAVHVPFKSGAEMMTDIIAGNTDFAIDNLATSFSAISNGDLKALAVTNATRWDSLPDVPTMAEAGYPQLDLTSFYSLVAAKDTDPAVLDKLNTAIAAYVASPEGAEQLGRIGAVPFDLSPADYPAFITTQGEIWRAMIVAGGTTPLK
ncbi:Bug family tripartite tricarboxylate transporter substrate binding protein [Xinfangfangia pollutisoli]|uniref:Bug family tripartite tricarboxylate transporter substrate binding protein n=1 Tax=Xinfangfangia pollutisoli TaxID=2865960 RepID=UPI001CD6BE73|nr:tripartite tricarboxylate transporter substrate binding protein [Xinfangfangia pollutisoli]